MARRTTADRWAVITWHKEGLTAADICRKTEFDRQFVDRWVKKLTMVRLLRRVDTLGARESGLPLSSGLSKGK